MSNVSVGAKAKETIIELVITHADGRVEYRTSYWHRNPLKRWLWRVRNLIK